MTNITILPFASADNSIQAKKYTLNNGSAQVSVSDYGATILSILVPDKNGVLTDVALGFDTLDGYFGQTGYIGATVGRYANRIKRAKFSLDGREYPLYPNDGKNHLHGGKKGFDKRIWNAEITEGLTGEELKFTLDSADMEEGYPGRLQVALIFSLSEKNELTLRYTAVTDRKTIVNLTNHCYYNLNGAEKDGVANHIIRLNSQFTTIADTELMPTGEIAPVAGTALDFTSDTLLADRINRTDDPAIANGRGVDQNFIIDKKGDLGDIEPVAFVKSPETGIIMEVSSNQPGVQLYTAGCLDLDYPGKKGKIYGQHDALCLETQVYPDSPNFAHFTSAVLKPGEQYNHVTTYAFSVEK